MQMRSLKQDMGDGSVKTKGEGPDDPNQPQGYMDRQYQFFQQFITQTENEIMECRAMDNVLAEASKATGKTSVANSSPIIPDLAVDLDGNDDNEVQIKGEIKPLVPRQP